MTTSRCPEEDLMNVETSGVTRRLGYLPQNLGYYPGFTVVEFVEYFALLKEMPPARIPAAVTAAVERRSGPAPGPR
jgi:ABC-type multidrug transport system ATPase subunit